MWDAWSNGAGSLISAVWVAIPAFFLSLMLTPVIRDIFSAYNVVDQPDSTRKKHSHPIPRVGGIALALSYFFSFYLPGIYTGNFADQPPLVSTLLPSALVIFSTGLIDDFWGLKPWHKLTAETVAAAMAYWGGVRVLSVGGHGPGTESWGAFLLTVVWLVACTNAFNLIDGVDGLAAGIGFFSTITIFISAIIHGNPQLGMATLPLAACLLAFLCYNFSPATIFLGDGGSLLIGFLLGCYGAVWSTKSVTMLGMLAPLMALSLPLLDSILAIARRFLRRQPIFGADRGHIHHRLIDRGMTPRRVVLIAYGVCGIAAAFSLVQSVAQNTYISLAFAGMFAAVILVSIRYLSYTEFIVAGRIFRAGEFQRALSTRLALEDFTTSLFAANTPEDCWSAVRQHCPRLGFCGVHLSIDGISWREWVPAGQEGECWTLRVPLGDTSYVELARRFRSPDMPGVVVPLADLLRYTIADRIAPEDRRLGRPAS
jgi:UDP-GlcNAc:undecaprenyl-phosphate/decaprenyl-phosphate GlcNAc-1-phosphate transferase